MPLSIAARCADTGRFGVAVASYEPHFGPVRDCLEFDVGAVASQPGAHPGLAHRLLDLLRDGIAAANALDLALASVPAIERVQAGVVDAAGRAAAFSGARTPEWRGHRTGAGWAASGHALARGWVVEEMGAAFESNAHLGLDERLVAALEAGLAAGGDRRGHRTASLRVATGEPDDDGLELRVHMHDEPVAELRRLLRAYHDHQRSSAQDRSSPRLTFERAIPSI